MAVRIPEMDVSARAGMLLAGFVAGQSNQPNLLTRATRDQALIIGLAAATAYGWGASAHSFYRSIAARLPMAPISAGLLVDAVAAGWGLAAMRALPAAREQSNAQATAHLLVRATTGAGIAGLIATSLEPLRGRRGGPAAAIATLAGVVVGSWAVTRPGKARFGSDMGEGTFLEDTPPAPSPAHGEVADRGRQSRSARDLPRGGLPCVRAAWQRLLDQDTSMCLVVDEARVSTGRSQSHKPAYSVAVRLPRQRTRRPAPSDKESAGRGVRHAYACSCVSAATSSRGRGP